MHLKNHSEKVCAHRKKILCQHHSVADIDYNMCLTPIRAELNDLGTPTFTPEGSLTLPCGTCFECLTKRTQEWATRASHEMSLHKENCFLTLTYDNDNLPSIHDFSQKTLFRLFIKRLRKSLGDKKIKYLASHEFGGQTFRPHHHLIIFGWSPANQKFLKNTPAGYPIFRAPHLEKNWEHGYSSVAEANSQTAYYVASYALKGKKHTYTDPLGEVITVKDSMTCSQGIGLKYAQKNLQHLVDSNKHIPRYYKKKLFEQNPILHEQYDERESFRNPRTSSDHEKYAKFINNERKKTNSNETFRSDTNDKKQNIHYKVQLKTNRSNSATYKPKGE